MIEDLKEGEYLNTIPRFSPFKDIDFPFYATDSYSFGVNSNERMISGESIINTGCHSFVKSRVFGKGFKLCVVVPAAKMFYQEDEITKYIDLLKEIGFQIDFKGALTDTEIKEKHGYTNISGTTKRFVFLLGEDYTNNMAQCRYVALCLLRHLWNANQFYVPYRFFEFLKYFKKRKIKPSLSKILILANLCPHNLFDDSYLSKRLQSKKNCEDSTYVKNKDKVNIESGLFGAYYGLIGHSRCDIIIGQDDQKFYKSFYISLLLAADNKFNLVDFIQNYQNNGKIPTQVKGLFINSFGKTRAIWDEENILSNKLRELLKEKQYYKAFLYLKELANHYKQFPDTHFSNVPNEQLANGTIIELKKEEGTKFIKEFVEATSKEKKKSK